MLLNIKGTRVLPRVILEAEETRLSTNLLHNLLHSLLLLGNTSNCLAVVVTGARPANLGNVLALGCGLGAHLGGLVELLRGKVAGHVGRDGRSEVRVHLHSEDVDMVAQRGALLLPGADGLGGGDSDVLGEASALERLADVVDVRGQLGGRAVVVEHALVADDDHGDTVLRCVVLDVVELVVGVLGERSLAAAAAGLKENAVDDLQVVLLAGRNDVLEDTAVGAVGTDGGEAKVRDLLDVRFDIGFSLAVAVRGVGSVGHGPLIAIGDDTATIAVAASRLRLVSSLGAAGLGLGCVDGLRAAGSRLRGINGLGGILRSGGLGGLRNLLRGLRNSRLSRVLRNRWL